MEFENKIRSSQFQKKKNYKEESRVLWGFFAFLGAITYCPSRERNFLFRRFRACPKNSSKCSPGEQQTFGEIRVSIGDVATVLGSRA